MFIVYFLPLINWYAWARVCVKREGRKTLLLFICKSCVSFFLLLLFLLLLLLLVTLLLLGLVWFFLNWVTHVTIKAEIVCVYNIHNKLNTHNQHQNYAHSVRILISKIIILYTYTHTHDCRVVYSKSYQLVTRKNISSKNYYMHMYLIHSCIYVFMSYIVYKYVYMYMILRGWRKTWSLTLW